MNTTFFALSLPLVLLTSPLSAQLQTAPDKADIIEQILTLREPSAFQKAIDLAKEAKVSEQILFEAHFLYAIDQQQSKQLAELLPTAIELTKTFKASHSEVFSSTEDWLAVVNYLKAIDALKRNDDQQFKAFITEAYWLSPQQSAAFSPHIEAFKIKKLKQNFSLPLDQKFALQNSKTSKTLEQLAGDNKGILIYAYSPWSREASNQVKQISEIAKHSKKLQLTQLQFNIEDPEESAKDNDSYKKSIKTSEKLFWIQNPSNNPLIEQLRIKQNPILIALNKEGKILFHGSSHAFLQYKHPEE